MQRIFLQLQKQDLNVMKKPSHYLKLFLETRFLYFKLKKGLLITLFLGTQHFFKNVKKKTDFRQFTDDFMKKKIVKRN